MSARAVISDQGVRTSTKRPNKQHIAFGSAAPQMCTNKKASRCGKRMESMRSLPYLSVCAAGASQWNLHRSPGSHLQTRHRRGSLQAPPGAALRPLPCWASSEEPLEAGPRVARRAGETSLAPRPRGWGCTRSLLRHRHHSPLQGPRSETERIPLPGRCSPKISDRLKMTNSNDTSSSVLLGRNNALLKLQSRPCWYLNSAHKKELR